MPAVNRNDVLECVTNQLFGSTDDTVYDYEDITGDRTLDSMGVLEGELDSIVTDIMLDLQGQYQIVVELPASFLRLDQTVDQIVDGIMVLIPKS